MKITPLTAILASILITAAAVAFSFPDGAWKSASSKKLEKFAAGEVSSLAPADIRGSFTFGEISSLYGIPLADLAAAYGVPAGRAAAFKCKDLEALYPDKNLDIGTGSVRLFVACYLGLPFASSAALPAAAAAIIRQSGRPLADQLAYLEAHTVNIPK